MKWSYKEENAFEKRRKEAERILQKYPNKCPIILQQTSGTRLTNIRYKKYLVNSEVTVEQFYSSIRQTMRLAPEEAFFLFVRNEIPMMLLTMGELYQAYHEDDQFLYVVLSSESTYGNDS
ncbi:hypothetical protein AB6A40_007878 [Gnathostoma spinigerum]|uniref:Autophagy-related protein n=1 Tax=Gnathostoma spinigerum TaxID=75299 RepID=A0ABD6EV89_9BILA